MSDLVTRLLSMDEFSSYDPPSVRDLYKEAAAAIAQQEELLKTWAQQSDALVVAIAEKETTVAMMAATIRAWQAENERLRRALTRIATWDANLTFIKRTAAEAIKERQ